MTFVGKIFVVLQLVLTICFMGWAAAVYTTQMNWREEAQSITDQTNRLQGELANAKSNLQKLKTTTANTTSELKEKNTLLSGKNKTLNTQVAQLESTVEATQAAIDKQSTLAKIAQQQAQFRKEETLRQRANRARLQQKVADLQKGNRLLAAKLFEKETSIAQMKERHQAVLANMEMYRNMLLVNNESLDPNDYNLEGITEPPPQVVGRVLDTQRSKAFGTRFIAISLGKDDGFHKNDTLVVYRGDEYLGKIRLSSVYVDKSVGQLIPGTSPRNASIQKGDHVHP